MRNLDTLVRADRRREGRARAGVKHVTAEGIKRTERNLAKARAKDSLKAFAKLTKLVDGEPRIVSDPPLIVPVARSRRRRSRTLHESCAT